VIRPLKKRYIGFRVTSSLLPSRREVLTLVLMELHALGHDRDKMLRVRVLDYDGATGVGMLLCDHKSVAKIRDAFRSVQEKSHGQTTLHMIGVSGTIRALKRKFLLTQR